MRFSQDRQILPRLLMRENAADPSGRIHKLLPYPAEGRILHKESHLIFSRIPDIDHTSGSRSFHTRRIQGGKAGQERSKSNGKVYRVRFSNQLFH